LKKILKVDTDQQLSAILGVSPQVLSNWKSRKRIDYSHIIDFSKKKKINLHWLFGDEMEESYPVPGGDKQSVNEMVASYVQKDECPTCKVYEKTLHQFELIVQQQGKTIDLLSTELENLRKLCETILKRSEDNSRSLP
jgi:hypothetical protein